MSAAWSALRRVGATPGLWLGTWVGLVALAGLAGLVVREVTAAAVLPFGTLDPSHLIAGLAEVLGEHRAVTLAVTLGGIGPGIVAAGAWALLFPVAVARLAGRDWPEATARAVATLPGVLVQSLWHLPLRAALVLVVAMSVQPLPVAVAGGLLAAVWLVCGVCLDVSRVAVVEHGASPYHPRTAWRGLVTAVRSPWLLLPCALLALAQLALSATLLWLAVAGLAGGSTWPPRLAALLSVGLGLWRIATVVEHLERRPPAAD